MNLLKKIIIVMCSCIISVSADAAEFYLLGESNAKLPEFLQSENSPSKHSVEIVMVGEIIDGDYEKFLSILNDVEARFGANYSDGFSAFEPNTNLWLHSPGGSYDEGLKISKKIADEGIGTALKDNAKCYSACAIIFMHGSVRNLEQNPEVRRLMSPLARLGFHAPYLNLPDGDKVKRKLVQDAYDYATISIASLLTTATNNHMPRQLVAEMLFARRDEFFEISTIDDLGRFWIDMVVPNFPSKITYEMFHSACHSHYNHKRYNSALLGKSRLNEEMVTWKLGDYNRNAFTGDNIPNIRRLPNLGNQVVYRFTVLADGPSSIYCAIDLYLENGKPKKAIIDRLSYDRAENNQYLDGEYVYWLSMLHPSTPLTALPSIFSNW